jgi:hypothetical protein
MTSGLPLTDEEEKIIKYKGPTPLYLFPANANANTKKKNYSKA